MPDAPSAPSDSQLSSIHASISAIATPAPSGILRAVGFGTKANTLALWTVWPLPPDYQPERIDFAHPAQRSAAK